MKKPRGPQPDPLVITEPQRAALWQITRRNQSPQALVTRARLIVLAAEGARNQHIADALGLHGQTVSYWRTRWHERGLGPRRDRRGALGAVASRDPQ